MDILLINENAIKTLTPISQNCSLENPLVQSIQAAQVNEIYPLLGKDLYNQIQLELSTSTLTVENQTLIEKLQNFLAWGVYYVYLPYNYLRTRDSGTVLLSGNNYVNVDLQNMIQLKKEIYQQMMAFKKQFYEWLCDNTSDYPLWCDSSNIKGNGWQDLFINI